MEKVAFDFSFFVEEIIKMFGKNRMDKSVPRNYGSPPKKITNYSSGHVTLSQPDARGEVNNLYYPHM
jgi:hypothetical protein